MDKKSYFLHSQGIVDDGAMIGANSKIWAWSHILKGAVIGSDCNICDHSFIENGVSIGDRVTIKCGVYIWDGITIEDDVFIGPAVAFTNDKFPRSKHYPESYAKTKICKGASVGANATILPVTIGAYAMIGAGAVVTKDVPPYAIVQGNPARIVGYVDARNVNLKNVSTTTSCNSDTKTGAKIYNIPNFSDARGDLSVMEFKDLVPFEVKRLFYTYNVASQEVRGEHAHKKCEQFLVAINGSLHVIVDDGHMREEILLENPNIGLHLPSGCWGIQYKHSADCVLLVLASRPYEKDDYITNYNEFIEYKRGLICNS